MPLPLLHSVCWFHSSHSLHTAPLCRVATLQQCAACMQRCYGNLLPSIPRLFAYPDCPSKMSLSLRHSCCWLHPSHSLHTAPPCIPATLHRSVVCMQSRSHIHLAPRCHIHLLTCACSCVACLCALQCLMHPGCSADIDSCSCCTPLARALPSDPRWTRHMSPAARPFTR